MAHLNAHDGQDPACLCSRCLPGQPAERLEGGERFVIDSVEASGRQLYFWLPLSLMEDRESVRDRVRARLAEQLARPAKRPLRRTTVSPWLLD